MDVMKTAKNISDRRRVGNFRSPGGDVTLTDIDTIASQAVVRCKIGELRGLYGEIRTYLSNKELTEALALMEKAMGLKIKIEESMGRVKDTKFYGYFERQMRELDSERLGLEEEILSYQ